MGDILVCSLAEKHNGGVVSSAQTQVLCFFFNINSLNRGYSHSFSRAQIYCTLWPQPCEICDVNNNLLFPQWVKYHYMENFTIHKQIKSINLI